jgi:hypothetical protein
MRWVITDSLPSSPAQARTCGKVGAVKLKTQVGYGNRADPGGEARRRKRLMKGAFREQLEQAVRFENQVFAERVMSRSSLAARKACP